MAVAKYLKYLTLKYMCFTREQCLMLMLPCCLTVVLWLIVSFCTHDAIPTDLNKEHWKNFTNKIQESLRTSNEDHVLGYLLATHALQVVCCVPLMHITKLLYGYFYGTVVGGVIGSAWEMGLVTVFVLVCVQNVPSKPAPTNLQVLLDYVESLRQKNRLYLFLVFLQMASVPLVTGTSLILFQVVSSSEFIISHMVVTVIMTFKDTFLGAYIYAATGDTKDIVIASVLFLLSTLLPTLLTIAIMGMISRSAIEAIKYVQNEECMEHSEALITDQKRQMLKQEIPETPDTKKKQESEVSTVNNI